MPPASRRSIIAFWLVQSLAQKAFAQDLCLVPTDLAPNLAPPSITENENLAEEPVDITATRFGFNAENELQFDGEVEIRQGNRTITAQSATREEDGDLDVLGRITLSDPEVSIFGEDAHYDADTETISFWPPASICRCAPPAARPSRSR